MVKLVRIVNGCYYFYRGSCLNRRLKEREKEREVDVRDRQREKEELEEIKRKLLDEGYLDLEVELMKVKIINFILKLVMLILD